MITGMHHGNIIVSDIERSKKFYTEVLGLEIILETRIDEPEFARGVGIAGAIVQAVFFAVPNTTIRVEMFQYLAPHPSRPILFRAPCRATSDSVTWLFWLTIWMRCMRGYANTRCLLLLRRCAYPTLIGM